MKSTIRFCLYLALAAGALFSLMGCASTPEVAKQEPIDLVWPLPPDPPRIKYIASYSGERDFNPPMAWLEKLVGPDPQLALKRPFGVVADDEGNVYVSDTEQSSIFVFDLKAKKMRLFAPAKIPLQMDIIRSKGILMVADSGAKQVLGLRLSDGSAVLNIAGQFKRPASLSVDERTERIYVGDSILNTIQVFAFDGKYLFTFGRFGNGDGEFNMPLDIDTDSKGNIYVADAFNYRIQIFDRDGKYLSKIGYGIGYGRGNFSKLKDIAIDSEDHVYALDIDYSNVQIFDKDNNLYLFFGAPGKNPGQFYLPSSIYINKKTDRIYVADSFNRRVQVFQYLK